MHRPFLLKRDSGICDLQESGRLDSIRSQQARKGVRFMNSHLQTTTLTSSPHNFLMLRTVIAGPPSDLLVPEKRAIPGAGSGCMAVR